MANSSFTQKITLDGGDQIKKELADIGKGGESAFGQIGTAATQISQNVQSAFNQLRGAIGSFRQDISSAGGALGKTFEPLISAAESAVSVMTKPIAGFSAIALAAGGVSGAISAMGSDAAASITKINDTAVKAGATLSTWRALLGGAKGIGVEDKAASSFLEKLQELSRQGAVDRIRKVVDLTRGIKKPEDDEDEDEGGSKAPAIAKKTISGGIGDIIGAGQPLKPIYGPVVDPLKATGTEAQKSLATFKSWGIQLVDSMGKVRSSTELMGDVVRHLAAMGDSARRTEEAYLALGKSVGDTAIAFADDKELFDATVSSVAAASPALQKGQIDLSEKIRATGSTISIVVEAWKQYVAAVAQPVTLDANNAIIDFLKSNRDAIKGFVDDFAAPTIRWLGDLKNTLGAAAIAAAALGLSFGAIGPLTAAALGIAGGAFIFYWEDVKKYAAKGIAEVKRIVSGNNLNSWDGWKSAALSAWVDISQFAAQAYQRLKAYAADAFPSLAGIWNSVENAFSGAWNYILAQSRSGFPDLVAAWGQIKTAATFAWDVITTGAGMAWAAIQKIMTVANEAAGVVNGLFGSHFTGATLLATAGFLLLAKSLLDIPGYIKLIVAILSPFAAAFALVTAAVRGAGAGIDYVLGKIQYLADLLSDKLIDALHKLAGDDLWNGMKNAASATLGFIQSALEGIKSAAQNAWSAITGGGSSSPSSSSSPSGGAASSSSGSSHPSAADYSGVQRSWTPGHADGGQIKGPGTGTSDSILARLSNGEFVINAKAVAALGPRFFHALNNMELPGFAMGGLVMEPAFASGGMVSALASSAPSSSSGSKRIGFSLDLFGQSYHGLSGPAETLDALERHSAALQMAATSKRAPSRVR